MSPSLAPTTVVGWVLYGLATTLPGLVVGALDGVRIRRGAPLDRELLVRISDRTEDSYADIYEAAVSGNHTAEDVRRSLERLERRRLIQRHPVGGWALTDRGRVAVARLLTPDAPTEGTPLGVEGEGDQAGNEHTPPGGDERDVRIRPSGPTDEGG